MGGMWKRWSHAFRAAALTVFGMIAAVLLIMALPFVAPIMAWAEKRAVGSKRRLAERWPCGWCMVPLRNPALARADAIHAAQVDMVVGDDRAAFARLTRTLDACCPHCDAGYRHVAGPERFELLNPDEFACFHGPFIGTAVPPPTGRVPWPWRQTSSSGDGHR